MTEEGAPCTASLGFSTDGFGDAPVESLDKTVGLRPLMSDAVMGLSLARFYRAGDHGSATLPACDDTGFACADRVSAHESLVAAMTKTTSTVIASEAKQSISPREEKVRIASPCSQ
jgi:hypothetical protein